MLQRTLPHIKDDGETLSPSAKTPPIVRAARPIGLKMKNADAPAVKREEEEDWGKQKRR
jgi:hypothetical protein